MEEQRKTQVQSKCHPRRGHEDKEGRYCSTLSLTSALDAVSSQRHEPAALRPEKTTGNHYKVAWVGPWDSLDICGKCCPTPRDSMPGPSSP
jgi:hypothetical protein